MSRFASALTLFAGFALLPAAVNADDAAPLLDAVRHNDIAGVRSLLNTGAEINATAANGASALHVAAAYGYTELVDVLVSAGARVDARGPLGDTALSLAAQEGHADIAGALLAAGADPDLRSDAGASAASYAAAYGHRDIVAAIGATRSPVVAPVAGWKWLVAALTAALAALALTLVHQSQPQLRPAGLTRVA